MARYAQRNSVITSVCCVVFFLVLSIFTMGLSQADDSWYLSDGTHFEIGHFLGLHYWSPLYVFWFRLLSFVWTDPVVRYFASWVLLVLLSALVPLAFGVRYAWMYTFIFVVVPFATIDPYIGMFAGLICVVAMCLVLRRTELRFSEALAAACVTCCVVAYCRSEFDYGVFLATLATVVAVAWEWRSGMGKPENERRGTYLAGIVVLVLIVAAFTALVMSRAHGGRSGEAFAQHYNLRAALRGLIPPSRVPAWQSNYVEQTFGIDLNHTAANGTATLGDFFRAKPGLFLGHVVANALDPLTVVVFLLTGFTLAWPWIWPHGSMLRPASLFLGVIVAPALMDMTLIYPRHHYVMILLPSVVIFALQSMRAERWLQPSVPWVLVVGMVAMFYINIEIPHLRWDPPTADQVMLSQVECLRRVDRSASRSNTVAFDSLGIRDVYLTTPRRQVDQWTLAHWGEFKGWAAGTHPAWVTVDDGLPAHYGVEPAELQTFLTEELHYVAMPCPEKAHLTVYTPANR